MAIENVDVRQLKYDVESLGKRISDVDNMARKDNTTLEDLNTAFTEHARALRYIAMQMQELIIGYHSQSFMSDTMIRYLAGYEKGDYRAEVAKFTSENRKPELTDLLVKDPKFDVERFDAIAQEIAEVEKEAAQARAEQMKAEKSAIVQPNGKPAIQIVR